MRPRFGRHQGLCAHREEVEQRGATYHNVQTLESAARAAMVGESDAIAGDRHDARPDLRHAAVGLAITLLMTAMLLALRVS